MDFVFKYHCNLNTIILNIIDHVSYMGHPKFKSRFDLLKTFDSNYRVYYSMSANCDHIIFSTISVELYRVSMLFLIFFIKK